MAIYIGDQKIGKLYIGDVAINEAYIGNELVYKSGGSWQTIWEGTYSVTADTTDAKIFNFADAGNATKFRISYHWTYGTYNTAGSYYRIPGQYPVSTYTGTNYSIEAEVSTEHNADGYTIIELYVVGYPDSSYKARYIIEKGDTDTYCKMRYKIVEQNKAPTAVLRITKIEALA